MIYVSFVEIMSEALLSFEEELHGQSNSVFLAHLYTSLTLFGGIAFGYGLDYIVHLLGYSHSDLGPQTPAETPRHNESGNGSPRRPCHLVPNASTHSDRSVQSSPKDIDQNNDTDHDSGH